MRKPLYERLRPLSFAELQARVAVAERYAGATIIPTNVELRARGAVDARRANPMTNSEWNEARANLTAFFAILAEWSERVSDEHP